MSKAKPDKKAFQVNTSNLDSGHESVCRGYVYETFYAENEKDARTKALLFLERECGIEEDYLGDPLTYITVKVKRFPAEDGYLVDGKIKTQLQIDRDKERSDRDTEFRQLLKANPGAFAYIKKGGYYYRPNSCGYTEFQSYAGVYPLEKAVNECLGMSLGEYMRPVLINVNDHNKLITDQIDSLKTRLILLKMGQS